MADTTQSPEHDLPPVTLLTIVDFLANQAYLGLGGMKDPETKRPVVDLRYSRHMIDMLDVLRQKTAANATAPEKNYVENVLYQLRMTFVRVQNHPPQAQPADASSPAGDDRPSEDAKDAEPPTEEAGTTEGSDE